MDSKMKFNEHFKERIHLSGGKRLRMRLVRPSDKEHVRAGFMALSAPSRHRRFLGGKQWISEQELKYFTELDHFDHFAIGVMELDSWGKEKSGVAIARFVRLREKPESAEVAITVADHMQGMGIGKRLLEALVEAASERGIQHFRFECLPNNLEIQQLVRKVCKVIDIDNEEGVMVVETNLPEQQVDSGHHALRPYHQLFDLFRAFAVQSLQLQLAMGKKAMNRTINSTFPSRDN